jgi:hypothetical protein
MDRLREDEEAVEAAENEGMTEEPLTDSEGLRVITVKDETSEDGESVNKSAREAYEAEIAADSDDEARENARAWEKFITR